MTDQQHAYLVTRLDRLNDIGIALSAERDTKRLLEMILFGAKEITNADSGTLYISVSYTHLDVYKRQRYVYVRLGF